MSRSRCVQNMYSVTALIRASDEDDWRLGYIDLPSSCDCEIEVRR